MFRGSILVRDNVKSLISVNTDERKSNFLAAALLWMTSKQLSNQYEIDGGQHLNVLLTLPTVTGSVNMVSPFSDTQIKRENHGCRQNIHYRASKRSTAKMQKLFKFSERGSFRQSLNASSGKTALLWFSSSFWKTFVWLTRSELNFLLISSNVCVQA